MRTIHELLNDAERRLTGAQDTARLDTEVLLAFALGKPRSYLHAWPKRTLDAAEADRFATLLARRAAGEPVAHIIGTREFWSMELAVTPDTLIPRPETELLVELALQHVPQDTEWRIADLGTGSGAIAIAIARERPRCHVLATDMSDAALAVARANAVRLGITNVGFRHGDWCAALAGDRFDLIVSNPPYVCADDPHLHHGDVRFEPRAALAAGADGLDAIRRIVAEARAHLVEGGMLLIEHGYDQGSEVAKLLREHGYRDCADHADLAGHGRVAQGTI